MRKVKIGLEIHAQMKTSQKLYCDCSTDYHDAEANTNICSICLGLPGNKPMPPNREALETAIEMALMLGCDVVVGEPVFIQRKHYDYPDLPNGYQKTSTPIAGGGELLGVKIREIHLEDDPGRYDLSRGRIDFNRSGVPLMEIVTEPDINSPTEARYFWNELIRIMDYTGKFRSHPGAVRADVNISLEGGKRVEIKNINSAKGIYNALMYEVKRQQKLLRRGREVVRETRGFVDEKMITATLRTKETFADYRYIPDPDIPPIAITHHWIDKIREDMVEDPRTKEKRLMDQYSLNKDQARILAYDRELANTFEEVAQRISPALVASWLTVNLRGILRQRKLSLTEGGLRREDLIKLLKFLQQGQITDYTAQEILERIIDEGGTAEKYLGRELMAVKDVSRLEDIVSDVITSNPEAISDFKRGNRKVINFLFGQVMKRTERRADPERVHKLLKEKLKETT
ncbi:MAG: Asp-tRNA(Asn)/Glu-tRNA(Gln) amidotransferase subunit GatB [Nitrososphaeria archaeon]|nr:Asp-tRNA(Asn)/Glu-tRNA(Gln) amidotransferase subunit GatB [Nitrososphaeria archaeon]